VRPPGLSVRRGAYAALAFLTLVTARAWRAARYGERAPPEPTPLEGG
jgi:hypothetical protein